MGQVTSTVLSLLVIPVVFTCVDDLLQWLRRHVLPERLESSGGGEAGEGPSDRFLESPSPD